MKTPQQPASQLASSSGQPLRLSLWALTVGAVVTLGNPLVAETSRILQPKPGGIDPTPIILGITTNNGRPELQCAGFGGGPFQAVARTNIAGGPWLAIGPQFRTNFFSIDLSQGGDTCFFKVMGPTPPYGGAEICSLCHSDPGPFNQWANSAHARAFDNLPPFAKTNAGCLPCHTVAFGIPGGYTHGDTALQGVQCENCHGPGGNSFATAHNTDARAFRRPDIEINAMLCGGCHTDAHHPTYDEWLTAGHHAVTETVAEEIPRDPTRVERCGVCHSGAGRLAMLAAYPGTNYVRPDVHEAAEVGVVCVVCHDPHGDTGNERQLRNPLFSTNFYSWNTSASFTSQYDPSVQVCAQCHNARNAKWTDTSRPPHYSPQYNMLVANIGVTTNAFQLRASVGGRTNHWALEDQCGHCHMQTKSYARPTEAQPNDTGHGFAVKYFDTCYECHIDPEFSVESVQSYVHERMNSLKTLLDQWAQTKAPGLGITNTLPDRTLVAWEYSTAGAISNPTHSSSIIGARVAATAVPPIDDQRKIPDNIKQARFNLYLVLHDGSYGVHNVAYANYLLNVAQMKVRQELAR